jgi:hypothetical protein
MASYCAIVYRSRGRARDWRWRIVAANGHIVAVSGEGYRNRAHAVRMAEAAGRGFGCEQVEVIAGRWRKP